MDTNGRNIFVRRHKSGLAPQSSEEQAGKILAIMPQVCEKYDIVPMTLMNIDSSDMTISDQKRIADTVNDNIGKYDGIVITHGTDTMAYTAAALSVMTENPPVPVVLTGSQRPFFDSGSDAPAIFEDALAVAGGGTVCRVCVVFGGKLWTEEIVPRSIPYRITLSPVLRGILAL